MRENLNPRVSIVGILPTMYDRRLTHSREADDILRENFGPLRMTETASDHVMGRGESPANRSAQGSAAARDQSDQITPP